MAVATAGRVGPDRNLLRRRSALSGLAVRPGAQVPEISLAAVWAGPPLEDAADKWKSNARVSALVSRLGARRTTLDEAEAITEFLPGAAAEKVTAGPLLFAGLFDTLNAQRSWILNGLERVTR